VVACICAVRGSPFGSEALYEQFSAPPPRLKGSAGVQFSVAPIEPGTMMMSTVATVIASSPAVMLTLPETAQSLSVKPVFVTVTEYVTSLDSPCSSVTEDWLTLFSMSHWYVRLNDGFAFIDTVHADAAGATTSVPTSTTAASKSNRRPLFLRSKVDLLSLPYRKGGPDLKSGPTRRAGPPGALGQSHELTAASTDRWTSPRTCRDWRYG